MAWFVYFLLCDQKTFYIGITNDVKKRVKKHQRGESFFTKKFSGVELVYTEKYLRRFLAEKRETQLKKWSFAKKRALVVGDKELLVKLSKGSEVGR